jgi:hypothetical protein
MARGDPRRGLATEIELALSGGVSSAGESPAHGTRPSVVWIMTQGELPRALVTDARGVVTPKVLDFVDLLTALDGSCTVKELEREPPERRIPLPALPRGALFVDLVERNSGSSYAVTGAVPPATHPFVAQGGFGEGEGGLTTTHDVPLPHVVYRAVWREPARVGEKGSLDDLCVALCSPDLEGPASADTQVFRWPYAHAYDASSDGPGAYYGRVCWGVGGVRCGFSEIPERAVGAFVSAPNDAGPGHAGQLSPYAPTTDLRGFLRACEDNGGLSHDWLEPFGMTLEDFHHQQRRES